jgi:FemAB family
MLTLSSAVGPLSGRTKWFGDRPARADCLRLVSYMQSSHARGCFGFVRVPCRTMIVDLRQTEDQIFARMSKSVQYKVRRAKREGVTCAFDGDIGRFMAFYRTMAGAAGRAVVSDRIMASAAAQCVVASATAPDGQIAAMHCYLLDAEQRRARMWHSASRYLVVEGGDSELRNLIGRANRLLHFESMLHFKERQFLVYDFGGYALDETDAKKANINAFKEGFGGDIVNESHYYSYPLYLGLTAKKMLSSMLG